MKMVSETFPLASSLYKDVCLQRRNGMDSVKNGVARKEIEFKENLIKEYSQFVRLHFVWHSWALPGLGDVI